MFNPFFPRGNLKRRNIQSFSLKIAYQRTGNIFESQETPRVCCHSQKALSEVTDIWNPIYKVCASPYFRRTNAFVTVAEFTNTLRGFSGGLVKPTRPLEHMICLASAECEKEYIAVCRIIE
jgi:hypothetical protein